MTNKKIPISDTKAVLLYFLVVVFFSLIYVILNLLIFGNTRSEEFSIQWGVSWRMILNMIAFFTICIGSKHITWWLLNLIEGRKAWGKE